MEHHNMLLTLANTFLVTNTYWGREWGFTADEAIKAASAYLETASAECYPDGYNSDYTQRIDYYFGGQGRKGKDGQYHYYQGLGSDFIEWLTNHFQTYSMQLLKEKKHG